jgi:hypothetical protein
VFAVCRGAVHEQYEHARCVERRVSVSSYNSVMVSGVEVLLSTERQCRRLAGGQSPARSVGTMIDAFQNENR